MYGVSNVAKQRIEGTDIVIETHSHDWRVDYHHMGNPILGCTHINSDPNSTECSIKIYSGYCGWAETYASFAYNDPEAEAEQVTGQALYEGLLKPRPKQEIWLEGAGS